MESNTWKHIPGYQCYITMATTLASVCSYYTKMPGGVPVVTKCQIKSFLIKSTMKLILSIVGYSCHGHSVMH